MKKNANKIWKRLSAMMLAATMIVATVPAVANAEVVKQDGVWVNVEDGEIQGSTYSLYHACAKNSANNTWWAIDQEGRVDFNYSGFAGNDAGWWYCRNGKVDFTANGLFKDDDDGDWYSAVNGKLEEVNDTLRKNDAGWWYVNEYGVVQFNFSTDNGHGLVKYKGAWWYIKGGKVDFTYTGYGYHNDAIWRIENGKVNFNCTDVVQVTENGEVFWVNFVNGKLVEGPTLAKNSAGWWYIGVNGAVDFTYDSDTHGLVRYNDYLWYIKGGKLDFTYNGNATYQGKEYTVVNGRASL